MPCKNPFRFCNWSSYSQAKKRRSTSLGFKSYGTRFPCFWIIPMALRRFEMASWVTSNDSDNSSCVWHESSASSTSNSKSSKMFSFRPQCRSSTSKSALLKRYVDRCPSLLCKILDLPISSSTYRCSQLSKNGGSKVVHLIGYYRRLLNIEFYRTQSQKIPVTFNRK